MDNKRAVVFMGPPGSGKGTQASLLVARDAFVHYDMGSYLRSMINSDSHDPLIGKIRAIVERGDLLPDDILCAAFEQMIQDAANKRAIIIDGIPRSKGQVDAVTQSLARNGFSHNFFVYLRVSDATAIDRLVKRAARKDDAPEVVPTRIANYHRITLPAIEYAKQIGACVVEIDGEPAIQAVYDAINRVISL